MGVKNVSRNAQVCLDSVIADSRCAPGAACIVAGEAICRFEVKTGSGTQKITLSSMPGGGLSGIIYPREAEVLGMRIRFETLTPYAISASSNYNDYHATITVTDL